MGYRSTVVLAVTAEADAKGRLNPMIVSMLDDKHTEKGIRDEGIFYEWNEIKWYDGYAGVDAINKWMNEMDKEFILKDDPPYQFARTGEESGDIEERGCCEFGIYVSTMIGY